MSRHTKKGTLFFSNLWFFKWECAAPCLVYRPCGFCLKPPQGLYYMSANNKNSSEIARAFAGRPSDKYHFLMRWLKYASSVYHVPLSFGVKCHAKAVKSLPVLHRSAALFSLPWIIESILILWKFGNWVLLKLGYIALQTTLLYISMKLRLRVQCFQGQYLWILLETKIHSHILSSSRIVSRTVCIPAAFYLISSSSHTPMEVLWKMTM